MNRYEILIGKELPPVPPGPDLPENSVRKILLGKRRAGKTEELINCIRKTVEKGIIPLVCLSHEPNYFLSRIGALRDHIYLTSQERLGRECRGLGNIKAFYYDDFDLVQFRKVNFDTPFGLESYSLDRRFVEMDEIVVACDMMEMYRYCQSQSHLTGCTGLDPVPSSFKVGFNTWEVVDVPRRSNDMLYTFNG